MHTHRNKQAKSCRRIQLGEGAASYDIGNMRKFLKPFHKRSRASAATNATLEFAKMPETMDTSFAQKKRSSLYRLEFVKDKNSFSIAYNGSNILENIPPRFRLSEPTHSAEEVLILGAQSDTAASHSDLFLGNLRCKRWLACARNKLWWMTPEWGSETKDLPPETQFLLLELEEDESYAIILPLIDNDTFRGTLRPPQR